MKAEGLQRMKQMTRIKRIVKSVADYFVKKGKVMTMKEYIAQGNFASKIKKYPDCRNIEIHG